MQGPYTQLLSVLFIKLSLLVGITVILLFVIKFGTVFLVISILAIPKSNSSVKMFIIIYE